MSVPASNRTVLGWFAAIATLAIGAGWQVMTRWGVTTTLHPVDLALLRYGVPGLVLLPVALKMGLFPPGLSLGAYAAIVVGGGLPFGVLCIAGSSFAPVAHMGVLVPGGIALLVALLTWLVIRQPMSRLRILGLVLLTGGLGLMFAGAGSAVGGNATIGHAMFLAAAALWVAYTLAFRRSGLQPLHAAALIGVWSLILVVPVWLMTPGAKILSAAWPDVAFQFLWQGVLAGIVAVLAYGVAVRELGAPLTTAIGALLPALVAVGGVWFLGEAMPLSAVFAVCLTVGGVFLLTGWLEQVGLGKERKG